MTRREKQLNILIYILWGIIAILIFFLFPIISIMKGYDVAVRTERCEATAVVTTKTHTEQCIIPIPCNDSYFMQYYPESYNITISCGKYSKTYDNKELYESFQENETIQTYICYYYDKYDVIIDWEFEFITDFEVEEYVKNGES